eukprot:symbB.v1.2.007606.t2/scaffold467.1/size200107/1
MTIPWWTCSVLLLGAEAVRPAQDLESQDAFQQLYRRYFAHYKKGAVRSIPGLSAHEIPIQYEFEVPNNMYRLKMTPELLLMRGGINNPHFASAIGHVFQSDSPWWHIEMDGLGSKHHQVLEGLPEANSVVVRPQTVLNSTLPHDLVKYLEKLQVPPSRHKSSFQFTLGVPMTQVSALLKRMPSMQQRHHATTSFCRNRSPSCSKQYEGILLLCQMVLERASKCSACGFPKRCQSPWLLRTHIGDLVKTLPEVEREKLEEEVLELFSKGRDVQLYPKGIMDYLHFPEMAEMSGMAPWIRVPASRRRKTAMWSAPMISAPAYAAWPLQGPVVGGPVPCAPPFVVEQMPAMGSMGMVAAPAVLASPDIEDVIKQDPEFARVLQTRRRQQLGLELPGIKDFLSKTTAVSLGSYCAVANMFEQLGLRDAAGPFDWMRSDCQGITHLILNGFQDFLEWEGHLEIAGLKVFPTTWGGSFWHHDLNDPKDNLLFVRVVNSTEELRQIRPLYEALHRRFGGSSRVLLLVLIDLQDGEREILTQDLGSNVIFACIHHHSWEARQRLHMASDAYCAALSRALYIWCGYVSVTSMQPSSVSRRNVAGYELQLRLAEITLH